MSLRAAKVTTTICLCLCVLLLVMWPALFQHRPDEASTLEAKKAFAVRFVVYISGIVALLVASAVFAMVTLRKTVAEVRSAQQANMKELIETTLEAHRKKSDEDV